MFLEETWPAQEWPMEKSYTRVLFSKVLSRDEFGVIPQPAIAIEYMKEEALLLKEGMEASRKKGKGKAPKKARCSPGKGKRGKKIEDKETLSADLIIRSARLE